MSPWLIISRHSNLGSARTMPTTAWLLAEISGRIGTPRQKPTWMEKETMLKVHQVGLRMVRRIPLSQRGDANLIWATLPIRRRPHAPKSVSVSTRLRVRSVRIVSNFRPKKNSSRKLTLFYMSSKASLRQVIPRSNRHRAQVRTRVKCLQRILKHRAAPYP